MEKRADGTEVIKAVRANPRKSYEEIGRLHGISKQRVQQIALRAGIRRRLSVAPQHAERISALARFATRIGRFFRG